VPTLRIWNRGDLPILILDGEELVGGQQNRVLNTTLLVPADTLFDLPVSCVESGRWHEATFDFHPGEAVYPTLRQQKLTQVSRSLAASQRPVADQGQVWEEIADRQRRTATPSATSALRDTFTHAADRLADAERALTYPEDGAVGVVALVGGRSFCADVFDQPATLRSYWRRLVRSYALEAADGASAAPTIDSALRLLRRPLHARQAVFPSPGLGEDVRLDGHGVVGAALVHAGVVVHTALFRVRGSAGHDPLIHRPSERLRRRIAG
jgi:hypothetical protein